MKKAAFILFLSSIYLIGCTETTDDHGHEHGPNGEHLEADHGHDHEEQENHDQEDFVLDESAQPVEEIPEIPDTEEKHEHKDGSHSHKH